jgi:glutamate--cysteine ligase catalytic subunit
MKTAHARNAVHEKKFHFRKNLFPARPITPPLDEHGRISRPPSPSRSEECAKARREQIEDEYTLLTIDEIINGSKATSDDDDDGFIGLIPLIESYLNTVNVDVQTRCDLARYLDLVSKRANGQLKTGATWIREFIRGHEDYRGDSRVTDKINYDLMKRVEKLGNGTGELDAFDEELLGKGWRRD